MDCDAHSDMEMGDITIVFLEKAKDLGKNVMLLIDMSDFSSGAVIQTMTKVITTVLPKGIVVVLGVSSGEASDLALIIQPLDRHLQDGYFRLQTYCKTVEFLPFTNDDALKYIKTHDSESRGQEEAGRTRDEQVSYLHVAPL